MSSTQLSKYLPLSLHSSRASSSEICPRLCNRRSTSSRFGKLHVKGNCGCFDSWNNIGSMSRTCHSFPNSLVLNIQSPLRLSRKPESMSPKSPTEFDMASFKKPENLTSTIVSKICRNIVPPRGEVIVHMGNQPSATTYVNAQSPNTSGSFAVISSFQ